MGWRWWSPWVKVTTSVVKALTSVVKAPKALTSVVKALTSAATAPVGVAMRVLHAVVVPKALPANKPRALRMKKRGPVGPRFSFG